MMTQDDTPAPVTGHDLQDWGHRPGPQFPALLARANELRAEGFGLVKIRAELEGEIPDLPPLLFVRGSIAICGHHTVAFVGHDRPADTASAFQCTSPAFCLTLDSSSSVAWCSGLMLRPIRALCACADRPLLSLYVVWSEPTYVLIARLRAKLLNPARF